MTTRAEARAFLAGLIAAKGVGTGLPIQAVYPYKRSDIAGQSPVVMVVSRGYKRPSLAARGVSEHPLLAVWLWVLTKDPKDPSVNEEDAEAILDACNEVVDAALQEAQSATLSFDYDGDSAIINVNIGGTFYVWETIPISVDVPGG